MGSFSNIRADSYYRKSGSNSASKVENAITEIENKLREGWRDWDVTDADLRSINQIIRGLSPDEKQQVVSALPDNLLKKWGSEFSGFFGGLSQDERTDLFNSLASGLDSTELLRISNALGDEHQADFSLAIQIHADSATRAEYVDKIKLRATEKIETPSGLSPEEKELYLDLAQLGLDMAGIAEPTPFADGTNGIISLFRGDWLGAGLSAISIIPYVGDLAKLGKLGKWSNTVSGVIDTARSSERFASIAKPVLEKISDAIGSIPGAVFDKLPSSAQNTLGDLQSKIKDFLGVKKSEASDLHWVGGRGTTSGRPFDPENAGGPVLKLDWRSAKINSDGIEKVKLHISRFESDPANKVMLARLEAIERGEIPATDYDLRFYTHELRELERYRNLNIPDNVDPGYEVWNNAHTATLEDFKLADVDDNGNSLLYHPDALAD